MEKFIKEVRGVLEEHGAFVAKESARPPRSFNISYDMVVGIGNIDSISEFNELNTQLNEIRKDLEKLPGIRVPKQAELPRLFGLIKPDRPGAGCLSFSWISLHREIGVWRKGRFEPNSGIDSASVINYISLNKRPVFKNRDGSRGVEQRLHLASYPGRLASFIVEHNLSQSDIAYYISEEQLQHLNAGKLISTKTSLAV